MLAAAMAAALAAGDAPGACAASTQLNAEQLEQRLDETAVSPVSAPLAERRCLAAVGAKKLGLTDPFEAILPGVAPVLALGRSNLFEGLANRLRAQCPSPAQPTPDEPGAARPKACGRPGPLAPWRAITPIDQSEQGFMLWLRVEPGRAAQAERIQAFFTAQGVGGIAPLYQILRTASDWQPCGGEPFALPPQEDWPRAARTLAWIERRVKPAIGPVEIMSGYREPALNACAEGAPESAHLGFWALDLEPLNPTLARPALMEALCRTHKAYGQEADIGLGFYAGVRFHVDDKRYRHWGFDPVAAPACAATPAP